VIRISRAFADYFAGGVTSDELRRMLQRSAPAAQ